MAIPTPDRTAIKFVDNTGLGDWRILWYGNNITWTDVCCCIYCSSCNGSYIDGEVPTELLLSLSDVADSDCTDCDTVLNDDFILTLEPYPDPPLVYPNQTVCIWKYASILEACCSAEPAWYERDFKIWAWWELISSTWRLRVQFFIEYCSTSGAPSNQGIVEWDSESATTPLCAFGGKKTLTDFDADLADGRCDFSGASGTIEVN